MTHLNKAASQTFIPDRKLYNKGAVPSRSKSNLVQQYNSREPDKYSIDIIILMNAFASHNFIYHIGVY